MKIKVDGHAWNGFEIRFLKSFGWMGFLKLGLDLKTKGLEMHS